MKMNSINMSFSSPVLSFTVPDAAELNRKLITEANALRETSEGMTRSNQHGWHSENDLFKRPEEGFQTLCKHIITAFNATTKKVAPRFKLEEFNMQMEGWININQKGAYNTPHDHPGYVWSGCYYVNQPAVNQGRSGMIEFLDPRITARDMAILEAAPFAPKFKLRPEAGTLLVFPSYLFHWVYPNERDDERMTIAWNGRYVRRKPKPAAEKAS